MPSPCIIRSFTTYYALLNDIQLKFWRVNDVHFVVCNNTCQMQSWHWSMRDTIVGGGPNVLI